jgi:mycothiol synthase
MEDVMKGLKDDSLNKPEQINSPDLIIREFSSKEDFTEYANILNACLEKDHIPGSPADGEVISKWFRTMPDVNINKDLFFAEVNGAAVGFAWTRCGFSGQKRIYYVITLVLPEWRIKGVDVSLLHKCEAHLKEKARKHPKDMRKFFQHWVFDGEKEIAAVLEKEGYEVARYFFEMRRPIEKPLPIIDLPEGLEIRPALPEHYRLIWDASEEACQDRWEYTPSTEDEYQQYLASPIFQPNLWKIAWDKAEVAGMVLNFYREKENHEYNRKRGYTERIRVRRPWRRQGLASALIVQSIKMFEDMGMEETYLQVDAENSNALNLYKKLGYEVIRTQRMYRKRLLL